MTHLIRRSILAGAVLGLMVGAAGSATADLIISSYPSLDNVGDILSPGISVGAGFTLPVGSAYTLDSVTLRLLGGSDTTGKVELFGSDPSGNPVGPALDTFSPLTIPTTAITDEMVTPTHPVTLQPSTTYWIVLTQTAGTSALEWWGSVTQTFTGVASSDGYRRGPTDPPTGARPGETLAYEVTGTLSGVAVPEPSTAIAAALGAVAFLAYGWSRHRRAQRRQAAA
jgi:hypothetical protein